SQATPEIYFLRSEYRLFSRRVEKRQLYDRCTGGFSRVFHCDFHVESGPWHRLFSRYSSKCDILLERRRPAAGGGVSNLQIILINRRHSTPGGYRHLRWKSNLLIQI